eukprot:RCo045099
MPPGIVKSCSLDITLVNPVVWSDLYLVGVPLIDNQHRRLFALVEDLRRSFALHKPDAVVLKTLRGLLSYCAEHFESEELLMQVVGCPSFSTHAAQHRKFTALTEHHVARFERGEVNPEDLFRFLMDWLVNHVMTVDVTIAQYCRKAGVAVSSIATVSDLVKFLEREQATRRLLPPELGFGLLLLPAVALFCVFGFWTVAGDHLRHILAGVAGAGIVEN